MYVVSLLLINITLFTCCSKQQVSQQTMQTIDSMKIKITIGQKVFRATLYDNPTAKAFASRLPITLNLVELNGNEKYADLAEDLPVHAFKPDNIQTGDLLLYGSSTVVLFYKTLSTSYSYTKLGKINAPSGLAAAVGNKNVTATFALE